MTQEQIEQIVNNRAFPYPTQDVKLIETHVSWVLLTDEYAYKIKKPLRFSFLDFSTIEKRAYYIQRELELNRRLAPDMYLGTLVVSLDGEEPFIREEASDPLDHVLLMKRMDETRQMDLLLQKGEVQISQVREIADILARFHQTAEVIKASEDWQELFEEFGDILSILPEIEKNFGKEKGRKLRESVVFTQGFLESISRRIEERKEEGYVVDGHGDLHSRNILLLDRPVIFDCIEFSDEFRTLDVLNEIAFFCMDLEGHGRQDLSEEFSRQYFRQIPCMKRPEDEQLFTYYKMYRANVLVKVRCLRAQEAQAESPEYRDNMAEAGKYLDLYFSYCDQIRRKDTSNDKCVSP